MRTAFPLPPTTSAYGPGRREALALWLLVGWPVAATAATWNRPWTLPLLAALALAGIGLAETSATADRHHGRTAAWLTLAFGFLCILKDITPSQLRAPLVWRTAGTEFSLQLPATHHPEPARWWEIGSGLLLLAAWIRTWSLMACDPLLAHCRIVGLVLAAAAATIVYYFAPGTPDLSKNAFALIFALGGVLAGLHAVAQWIRRERMAAITGLVALGLAVGLLLANSRGAVLGWLAGCAGVVVLGVARAVRTQLQIAFVTVFLTSVAALALVAPGLLLRFAEVFSDGRLPVWRAAIRALLDAPLLGHGLGSFEGILPFYSTGLPENRLVTHADGGWVDLAVEAGLPVTAGVFLTLVFLMAKGARDLGTRSTNVWLGRIAPVAALIAFMVAAIWDISLQRPATIIWLGAIVGLIPCLHTDGRWPALPARALALVGATLIFAGAVDILPSSVRRQSDLASDDRVTLTRLVDSYPLYAQAHQALARNLAASAPEPAARAFLSAAQLAPHVWSWSLEAAACLENSAPTAADSFKLRVMLAAYPGPASGEILHRISIPADQALLAAACASRPAFSILAAEIDPSRKRLWFDRWWQQRATANDLCPWEAPAANRLWAGCATPAQFKVWRQLRPELAATDYEAWARTLRTWGLLQDAWDLLARHQSPSFNPAAHTAARRGELATAIALGLREKP